MDRPRRGIAVDSLLKSYRTPKKNDEKVENMKLAAMVLNKDFISPTYLKQICSS